MPNQVPLWVVMVSVAVPVHLPMRRMKSWKKTMVNWGLSYLEVALHQVLHEYDCPVEQGSVLDSSMVVKAVRVHLGVDRQLACGWQSILPQELV